MLVEFARAEHTKIPGEMVWQLIPVYEKYVRDKKDAPILASVMVAKPDFTVTGIETSGKTRKGVEKPQS